MGDMALSRLFHFVLWLVWSAPFGHAQELSFANFASETHIVNLGLIPALDAELQSVTAGSVSVRAYHRGELGRGPVEQYVRAIQQVADITWGLHGYTSAQFPRTMIVEMPGVVPAEGSGADALCRAMPVIDREFPGTRPIALWTSDPAIMVMRDRIVRFPRDLKGLKIRVAGASAGRMAEALGAIPVQIPINHVRAALDTGLIDGVFTSASAITDFNLNEVAGVLVRGAPLGRLSFFAVMSDRSYEALPKAAQNAIDGLDRCALGNIAEAALRDNADAAITRAREERTAVVVDLTDIQIRAFERALKGVVADYVDGVDGQDVYEALKN